MPKKHSKAPESDAEPVVSLAESEIREIDTTSTEPKTSKAKPEPVAAPGPDLPAPPAPPSTELEDLKAAMKGLLARVEALESKPNQGVEETKGEAPLGAVITEDLLAVHREQERRWVADQILRQLTQSRR